MRIEKNWGPEMFPSDEDISHAKWLGNNKNNGLLNLNKHFEEFSEAAQVEIYRSAFLQLNIVKLRLRFRFSKNGCHFQMLYI